MNCILCPKEVCGVNLERVLLDVNVVRLLKGSEEYNYIITELF